jgi:hypothetical protein
LFSRFLYYSYDEVQDWKDVSPNAHRVNYDDIFDDAGQKMKILYEILKEKNIEIKLSEAQWEAFQDLMKQVTEIINRSDKQDFHSVVRRCGLIYFRLCMVLTILRNMETIASDEATEYYADDIDSNVALTIIKELMDHSLAVFDMYDKKAVVMTMTERNLINQMPLNFTRKEGLVIAEKNGVAERTFGDILKRWVKKRVIAKIAHGRYKVIFTN